MNFSRLIRKANTAPSIESFPRKRVVAVIPTYKPSETTIELIASLREFHPNIQIIVVNDCIPEGSPADEMFERIRMHAQYDPNIICLKTPYNSHKAGALNYGIKYALQMNPKPHVIFTSDDDVIINAKTIPNMVNRLYSRKSIGAVCSQSLVKNKKVNILTRLQALEYQGFTVTKIADNHFLKGPLVMQGMLTGFRRRAMESVKGYTPYNLIEDYEITVRLKKQGWDVAIAPDAIAWTDVPEDIQSLWRQRIRWGYWGLHVVRDNIRFLPAIFQDLVGHGLFLALLTLIILSFVFYNPEATYNPYIPSIIILSLVHVFISMVFNFVIMLNYKERDAVDWLIKFSIVPEFIYSNIITLLMLGCYAFYAYNATLGWLAGKVKIFQFPYQLGLQGFNRLGYSMGWGTRKQNI